MKGLTEKEFYVVRKFMKQRSKNVEANLKSILSTLMLATVLVGNMGLLVITAIVFFKIPRALSFLLLVTSCINVIGSSYHYIKSHKEETKK